MNDRGLHSPPPLAGEVGSRSDPGGGFRRRPLAPTPTLPRQRGRENGRHVLCAIAAAISVIAAALAPISVAIFAISTASAPALAQAAAFTPREEEPDQFPAGPGRDETFYACTACHNFQLVAAQGMNRRQWDDSINWMIEKHNMPPPDAKERATMLDYLEAAYPPKAPASRGGWQNPFLNR